MHQFSEEFLDSKRPDYNLATVCSTRLAMAFMLTEICAMEQMVEHSGLVGHCEALGQAGIIIRYIVHSMYGIGTYC